MNYTGRPSISGCRPVLSLYPTHRFCQYLLLIFITFTNSFLFNRAFSTNSRSPLRQRLPLWGRSSTSPSLLRNATARVAAPSVCFAAARILLAAAPTAPPCFRHWRRSSPLLLPRGGFGSPRRVNGFARGSPTRGAVEELATRLRGCTKESLTVSHCWAQPLRHCFAMPLPGLRLPASASLPLASCWPRPQQLLPVSATGGGRRRCSYRGEALAVPAK